MTEETKQPETQAEEQPKTRRGGNRKAETKQPEHGIKNMRSGDINLGGMLFIKSGQVVELTDSTKKNTRLMKKIKRGLETGILKEV